MDRRRWRLWSRSRGLLGGLVALVSLLGLPAATAAPESTAEALYRRGVHCMEVIERPKCAIEHFEGLLAENTRARELVNDAILRLIKLYRESEGADEPLRAVLRRFWAAGGRRERSGHLPYSAQFLPADLDMIAHVDLVRGLKAPLLRRLPPEFTEFLTTCDPQRRAALSDAWMVRRAQRRASREGLTTQEALNALATEEAARRARYEERRAEREAAQGEPELAPVFAEATCAVAQALGMTSTATWSRAAFAASHRDPRRSAALVMIPELAGLLAAAESAGQLQPTTTGRWRITGHTYEGAAVEVASFDRDELTIAPAPVMPEIAAAVAKQRATQSREVAALIATTPKELAFFAVTTGEALRDLGLSGASGSRRRLLEALLPRPEGLQIAGSAHEYLGLFLRMPTDNPVKIQVLVDLATRALEADDDPETVALLRGLDLARAADRRALLISYIAGPQELLTMLLD